MFMVWTCLAGNSARASQLKPETSAAFDRYALLTEARMDDDIRLDQFLILDRLPDLQRKDVYNQVQHGEVYIEELHTQEDHHPIRIPSGLIHHWAGVIFIPKATLSEVDAVLQDYENEPEIYKPEIRKAKRIKRNGNESKIFLQFYNKSLATVVLNDYSDVIETQFKEQGQPGAKRVPLHAHCGSCESGKSGRARTHRWRGSRLHVAPQQLLANRRKGWRGLRSK